MSRNTNGRVRQSQGAQIQRMDRMDPYTEMRQMMRGFGGFQDDFFGGAMKPFGSDPYEEMFNFSDLHKNVHNKGQEGSYVCQTYVSSSKMGDDGKMHRQDYFENNMGEHKGGNTISQKHQAFKNNKGVNRIAEQRMLNDKGRKIIKEKRGNDIQETNHYFNIDEEQANNFDSEWRRMDGQMNFVQNHQKYMKSLGNNSNNGRQLQYNPSSYEQKQPRNNQPKLDYQNSRKR